MSFSNILEQQVLQHFFKGNNMNPPTNLYVALYLSDPTENDTGTEVNGSGYARQLITFGDIGVSGSKSTISNASAISFPQAGSGWGTVTHFGIRNASSGGDLLAFAPLNISKTINSGDKLEFPASGIIITLD